MSLLTLTIFFPLIGAGLLLWLPRRHEAASREIALVTSLTTFAISLAMAQQFFQAGGSEPFALMMTVPWVKELGIYYRIGIDGVSLWLILLTTLLVPLCVLAAWRDIKSRTKEFMLLLMLVEIGLTGAFAALDLFLFYVFWEVMLIPMYFLVGVWGGKDRIRAAVKFLIYTLVGSLPMLVAILYMYFAAGGSFNLLDMYQLGLAAPAQCWLFAAFALAFAIKVPMFPLHTWLPDAHTEAPTVGSVLLAGVFLKVGTYGFYRFAMPLFPEAVVAAKPLMLSLAVIGIVGGALVSLVQPDVKRLIAYSSVSHLGFVMLGLFALTPEAVQGAILQMINHGISTGALFLLFGMLYERTHTRLIAHYGGIARQVPLLTVAFIVASLSSLGMPGLNNFVGEFLVLLGSFRAAPVFTGVAAVGVIFAAAYLLWMIERVFFGPMVEQIGEPGHAVATATVRDLTGREALLLAPLLVLMVWLGVAPRPVLQPTQASVQRFIEYVQHPAAVAATAVRE